jgi:predicted NAD/FAD-dependent oxidoreductase
MPGMFEDVEFRDVAETERHLGVCLDDSEQAARVARASAAVPAPKMSQLMNTVRDTVPDASSSVAEPVTAVEHMNDDDDDDDRPSGRGAVIGLSARPGSVSFRFDT